MVFHKIAVGYICVIYYISLTVKHFCILISGLPAPLKWRLKWQFDDEISLVIIGYVTDIYSNMLLSTWKEIRISDRQKQSFADVPQNRCSLKFREFYRKTLVLEALLKKGQAWRHATLLKETPTQVFSCKICEIVKGYYLCYETIFCHKVTLDVMIFFIWRKTMFRSRDIKIFVILWNLQILKSVTSS